MRDRDVLLLCTDGLYNAVSVEEITTRCDQVIHGSLTINVAVEELINIGLEHGARDNLTLIIYLHDEKKF